MDSGVRVTFECDDLIDRSYPAFEELNQVYFQRMISQEFLPPPSQDHDMFTFD